MKITAKQLRRIIREEAQRLNEIFTPIGGIGFGDLPRASRSDYHSLTIEPEVMMSEADADEGSCGSHNEAEVDEGACAGPDHEAMAMIDRVLSCPHCREALAQRLLA